VCGGQVAVQIFEQVKHVNEGKFHISDDSPCINRAIAYEIDLSLLKYVPKFHTFPHFQLSARLRVRTIPGRDGAPRIDDVKV